MLAAVEKLKQLYQWKEVQQHYLFPSGHMNQNLYVKANEKEYNLRFYKNRFENDVEFELDALIFLNSKKFPCPNPVKNIEGNYISSFNGEIIVCFDFIPGETLQPISWENVVKVARKTAEFHAILEKYKPRRKRKGETLNEFKQFVKKTKSEFVTFLPPFAQEVLPFIEKELNSLEIPSDLPKSLVHTDIKPENVVFHDNQITGFIDFDMCFYGETILDVASAALWWSLDEEVNKENLTAFLEEYQKPRKLLEIEKKFIKNALIFQALKNAYRYVYYVHEKPEIAKKNSLLFLSAVKQLKKMDLHVLFK